jgi:two-component system, NarL family, response regulator NreC
MSLQVLLADDQVLCRQAIAAALHQQEIEVMGQASNGREAVTHCRAMQPQVVVLGIEMQPFDSIDLVREIVRVSPKTRVLILSDRASAQSLRESLDAGAKGYVLKTDTATQLAEAIYAVAEGKTYISKSVSLDSEGTYPVEVLGDRERQVLRLLAEGKGTKEIADLLSITHETVRSHRKHIMKKLEVPDIARLVRYCINHGLLEPRLELKR